MTVTNLSSVRDSSLRQYIDATGDLPTDVLLGRLVFYTITDEPVAHSDLEKWFTELGLDKAYLPQPIRELDAFKKATSDLNRTKYPLTRAREAHLLCREVTSTPDLVKRQITREIKDSKNKSLSYAGAIDATFYRKTTPQGTARIKFLVQAGAVEFEEMDHLTGLTKELEANYLRYRDFHDGQKLRGLVRSYLKGVNGVEIRGGVYFIHQSREAELAGITELVNRFGGGCSMHTIPIVNLERERRFIAQAFEKEAAQSLQEVTKECKELLSTRKSITAAAYSKVKAMYDEVLAKADEHMVTLEISQEMTAASAEVALAALAELQGAMLGSK